MANISELNDLLELMDKYEQDESISTYTVDRAIGFAIDGWKQVTDHPAIEQYPDIKLVKTNCGIHVDSQSSMGSSYCECLSDTINLINRALPGWMWEVSTFADLLEEDYPQEPAFRAIINTPMKFGKFENCWSRDFTIEYSKAETAELALCKALVRALIAVEEND